MSQPWRIGHRKLQSQVFGYRVKPFLNFFTKFLVFFLTFVVAILIFLDKVQFHNTWGILGDLIAILSGGERRVVRVTCGASIKHIQCSLPIRSRVPEDNFYSMQRNSKMPWKDVSSDVSVM